jgi:Fic family protein
MDSYFHDEQDKRIIQETFDWTVLEETLPRINSFNQEELDLLRTYQKDFEQRITGLGTTALSKDLERLAIDLSWKSSQIEGNTYTLLETERLLKESKSADGKTREEALMLLNHKDTLEHILQNRTALFPLTPKGIKDIHYRLMIELDDEMDYRAHKVGITGTNYRPLDFLYDIDKALKAACDLINSKSDAFEKALLALALISYIQPFADGNKRTARLVCNGILLAEGSCPMSYRTVDSLTFKQAILLFYEQQNLFNLKRIFIEQYAFAVSTYF